MRRAQFDATANEALRKAAGLGMTQRWSSAARTRSPLRFRLVVLNEKIRDIAAALLWHSQSVMFVAGNSAASLREWEDVAAQITIGDIKLRQTHHLLRATGCVN